MCNSYKCSSCCSGIMDTLEIILALQCDCPGKCCNTCCDKPVLGCGDICVSCNTRPIMLYGCDGKTWKMPITRSNLDCNDACEECSNVFRIEKINCNAITFRVLTPNTAEEPIYPFVATDTYFTIDIGCICAIRCLSDTYVEGV